MGRPAAEPGSAPVLGWRAECGRPVGRRELVREWKSSGGVHWQTTKGDMCIGTPQRETCALADREGRRVHLQTTKGDVCTCRPQRETCALADHEGRRVHWQTIKGDVCAGRPLREMCALTDHEGRRGEEALVSRLT